MSDSCRSCLITILCGHFIMKKEYPLRGLPYLMVYFSPIGTEYWFLFVLCYKPPYQGNDNRSPKLPD